MINAFHFLLIIKSINYLDIYPKSKILKTKKSNMFQSIHFDIMITKRDIINCGKKIFFGLFFITYLN